MSRAVRCASWALAVTMATSTPAIAAEPSEAIVRAELELDTVALGDDGELIAGQIRVRGEALLRKHEVLPARGEDDPRIVVTIEPLVEDGPGYRCRWGIYRGADAIEGSDGVSLCRLCTETELVEHVELAIERAVANVPRDVTPPPRAPVEPTPQPQPKKGLGPYGKAGIGVGVLGVVALAVGIPLAVIEPKTKDASELGHDVVPTRPAGIALVGIGTAALITGLALIAVDRHRARGRGPARATPRARLVPAGAGVAIVGRF